MAAEAGGPDQPGAIGIATETHFAIFGEGALALAEFQKLTESRGIVGNCWSGALAILGQARAQTMSGNKNAARNSYQRFFDLWKTADTDLHILKTARAEFAKLQ